jgi:hypothetical protein
LLGPADVDGPELNLGNVTPGVVRVGSVTAGSEGALDDGDNN